MFVFDLGLFLLLEGTGVRGWAIRGPNHSTIRAAWGVEPS